MCDIITHREIPLSEVLRHARDFYLLRRVFGRSKMVTLEAYAGWCEEFGLHSVEADDISAAVEGTFEAWKENARVYESEVTELIGREELVRFVKSCDVLQRFWDDRFLGYGVVSASKHGG